jgi:hypothetical protein
MTDTLTFAAFALFFLHSNTLSLCDFEIKSDKLRTFTRRPMPSTLMDFHCNIQSSVAIKCIIAKTCHVLLFAKLHSLPCPSAVSDEINKQFNDKRNALARVFVWRKLSR